MKLRNKTYWLLCLILSSGFTNAQVKKSEFDKTVDTINIIIKANSHAYYWPSKQYSAFIKKISVTKEGIVSFTDSIPKSETETNKKDLIPDCCPRKNSRTLNLFKIKKWEIYFPIAYLKDENKETFAKFIGFKRADLEMLKEQFEKLKSLCAK
ncbi:hypothetical protein [Flavobacterium sp. 245]|uniref:hypothetical protein n=1 Tax=Flavobacterium sp. 245 TaxID=2512115 RepID=UPI00105C6B93|nr:hypothetical protein [Flavobacterium sp. 245]TDP00715.1 hypothetical protein EV145_10594 [Flavobacterium sp. 245]